MTRGPGHFVKRQQAARQFRVRRLKAVVQTASRSSGSPRGPKKGLEMFTGLVEALGQVEALVEEDAGKGLTVRWPGLDAPLAIGESVAVNGCCLTVVRSEGERFDFQAGPETLMRTNLDTRRPGDAINLERSLRVGDRLGGHFVQ